MVTTTAADAAKDAAAAASTAAGATAAAAVDAAKAILDAVPDEAKEEAAKLVSNVENVLTSQQMREASSVIIENLKNAPGATSTVCTCIGGAFTQVAECAPDVTQAVSDALIAIGPALGPISIACGPLAHTLLHTRARSASHTVHSPQRTLHACHVTAYARTQAVRCHRTAARSQASLAS
jgi:hypothetical protein